MTFEKYYTQQAGSGLVGYSGAKYQKGDGFFGKLIRGFVFPALRFLGKNALSAGVNVASDVLQSDNFSKDNIKELGMKHVKKQTKTMANDLLEKIANAQTGNGVRRRRQRKRKNKKINEKANKRIAKRIKGEKHKRKRKRRRSKVTDIFN